MNYHPTVNKILNLLKQNNYWFETFEHEEVRTSEEAARIRTGYTLHQGAKAIIVRVKKSESDKRFVMLVFPADLRFDNKKVKQSLGVRDIRFATEEEVENVTGGVKVGGVPPFGNLFNLEVYADGKLFEIEKIVFNAGDRRFSVAMKSEDYRVLVKPVILSITE
jgi:prolyl-tRNA editing enzyme YbaK/EbsC (Cys-tRNA(Pro) deacylase)